MVDVTTITAGHISVSTFFTEKEILRKAGFKESEVSTDSIRERASTIMAEAREELKHSCLSTAVFGLCGIAIFSPAQQKFVIADELINLADNIDNRNNFTPRAEIRNLTVNGLANRIFFFLPSICSDHQKIS